MATKTEKYELRKKEENDFYNIEDFNDNMDKLETALTEFDDSGSADGITSFTEMITKFVTGNKLAVTLRNLKAGLQFVLHTGSIVNNCVTDNPKLPLSAAQGKVLMDYFNQLNSNLGSTYGYIKDLDVPNVILGRYDANSANSPYKKGLTQATEGIVLSVYNANSVYNSQLALSAGNEKFYIRQKGNNTWEEWMAK